jgi:hypothetical protein
MFPFRIRNSQARTTSGTTTKVLVELPIFMGSGLALTLYFKT